MHRQGKTGFLVPLKVLRVVPLSALRWYHLQRYNGTASALSASIKPFRINKSRLIIEVETKQNAYFLLYEPRNSERKCWYINTVLASWQNSNLKRPNAPLGNFFYVPMATLLLPEDSEEMDAIVSFDEMKEICSMNMYEINY